MIVINNRVIKPNFGRGAQSPYSPTHGRASDIDSF